MDIVRGSVICAYEDGFVLQQRRNVYWVNKELENKSKLFVLEGNGIKGKLASMSRLIQRLVRNDIRAGAVFKGDIYFSSDGRCYKYNTLRGKLEFQHTHRKRMRSPLNYCVIENIKGFCNQICYGEYFDNAEREEVCIWSKSEEDESWGKVAAISGIRHIHGMFADKSRDCVYILTGDLGEECAIWKAKDNFKVIDKLLGGNQQVRACQMSINENELLYCTDSEYEQNALYSVKIEDGSRCEKIAELEGSVIHGASSNGRFVFSTTVEPNEGGIKSKDVVVYGVSQKNELRELFRARKDFLPKRYFQYGFARIVFNGNCIALSFTGVKKYDGKAVLIDCTKVGL